MKERAIELNKTREFALSAVSPFNFRLTVAKPSHFPTMLEKFDEKEGTLFRSSRLKNYKLIGLKISDLEMVSKNKGVFVEVYSRKDLSEEESDNLKTYINNACGLQENINEFYEYVAKDKKLISVINNLSGMRNSCFENLYEAMNIGVMLQNANIKRTEQMMSNMLSDYGNLIAYDGQELFAFYTPKSIVKTNEQRLQKLKIGYRAKFVMNTAKYFIDNEEFEDKIKKMNIDEARTKLLEIKGVGPYTANMLLFSHLRYTSFINFDVWNKKIIANFLFNNENVSVENLRKECEARWGRFQGYVALYIIENLFVNNPQLQYWRKQQEK